MFVKYIFVLLIFTSISSAVLVPTSVSAQSLSQEQYRATLLQLIDLLTQQIAQLQQQLETQLLEGAEQAQSGQPRSYLSLPEVAQYNIGSQVDVKNIPVTKHRRYLERVLEIFPDVYEDKIKIFKIFADGPELVDAYVETIPPTNDIWLFGVAEDTIKEVDSKNNTQLVAHEFAHVLAYTNQAEVPQVVSKNCGDYFDSQPCPLEKSYLEEFVSEFWNKTELARAKKTLDSDVEFDSLYEYYLLHESEYVTDYAALNPDEDFAESFVDFVFTEKPTRQETKDQKVRFFYQYPELLSLKAEILAAV